MTLTSTSVPLTERILGSFPAGNYALHAFLQILDIVESEEVKTAAVECRIQPRLLINPRFVEQHAPTPEKLLMLVMHELHHVLLGHTRLFPRLTGVDNFVFDAVINSLLCRMLPAPEHTRFFTDYYDDSSFPACLLRPPAGWSPDDSVAPCPPALASPSLSRARSVYEQLYSERGASYHDLYSILKDELSEELAANVPLLGRHGGGPSAAVDDSDLRDTSPVLFEAVRDIVEGWPQPPDPIAGRSLEEITRDVRLTPSASVSNRQVLRSLLRRVAGTDGRGSNRRESLLDDMAIETPVPTFTRRSVVLSALGQPPLLHRASIPASQRRRSGERVHVYLDVSGSIGDLKGALYGAVLDCSSLVHPQVHLFSTMVHDITLGGLKKGDCLTTGGTDIGCVAAHMKAERVKRAVVITDGFVGVPRGEHQSTMSRALVGVALTPGPTLREDLGSVTDYWAQLHERTERTA